MSDWALKLQRTLFKRPQRVTRPSKAFVSMADSLSTIAYGLKIVVMKEYGVDLDAPKPSRADLEREIFEPMYVNDETEAIREEVERIQALEAENRDSGGSGGSGGGKSHPNALGTQIPAFGMKFARTDTSGMDSDDLTEQERDFLAEISGGDE